MTPRDIFRSRQTKIFTALHCLRCEKRVGAMRILGPEKHYFVV